MTTVHTILDLDNDIGGTDALSLGDWHSMTNAQRELEFEYNKYGRPIHETDSEASKETEVAINAIELSRPIDTPVDEDDMDQTLILDWTDGIDPNATLQLDIIGYDADILFDDCDSDTSNLTTPEKAAEDSFNGQHFFLDRNNAWVNDPQYAIELTESEYLLDQMVEELSPNAAQVLLTSAAYFSEDH